MADDDPTDIAKEIFSILPDNLNREVSRNFPLDMKRIMIAQESDNSIQQRIASGKYLENIATINIDSSDVTTFNGKVWVPKELQQQIVEWYHSNLQHADINRTTNSISQTFAWKGLCPMVEKHVTSCDNCQRNKNTNKKAYGKIPLTSLLRDKNPWEVVHINCCSPRMIR
jgi:hypothetical protein